MPLSEALNSSALGFDVIIAHFGMPNISVEICHNQMSDALSLIPSRSPLINYINLNSNQTANLDATKWPLNS